MRNRSQIHRCEPDRTGSDGICSDGTESDSSGSDSRGTDELEKQTLTTQQIKVGVQLQQQGSSIDAILEAARTFDSVGVDSIWVWDHFFPIIGDPNAGSFEAYSLLAAIATQTNRATLGVLVTGIAYRNANLLADMARTIDHLSGGRFVLGLGSGWFQRDYDDYGYEFGTAGDRLRHLEREIGTIKDRLSLLEPPAIGPMPILIGGSGPKVTLRITAEHADAWNSFGPADDFARLSGILDDWCAKVGRNPSEIERTVTLSVDEVARWQDFVDVGATHLIVMVPHPFDSEKVADLVSQVSSR